MPTMLKLPDRHPVVPTRRVPLPEELADQQIALGLCTNERGVNYPMPIDHIKRKGDWQHREKMWVQGPQGTYRRGTVFEPPKLQWVINGRKWMRQHSPNKGLLLWNLLGIGHDLHVSTYANLYAKHWHANWADPFTGEIAPPLDPWFTSLFKTHWVTHDCDMAPCPKTYLSFDLLPAAGFTENLGLLSAGLVTTAFVSEEISELVSAVSSEYADYDFAEVGTSAVAENNTHVALQVTSGIARVAGTPTDSDPIYQSVATITADVTESWEEHGLFNNLTSVSMMDRSVTGGQSVNSSDQVEYTHQSF